jgi:hypothetical protein
VESSCNTLSYKTKISLKFDPNDWFCAGGSHIDINPIWPEYILESDATFEMIQWVYWPEYILESNATFEMIQWVYWPEYILESDATFEMIQWVYWPEYIFESLDAFPRCSYRQRQA